MPQINEEARAEGKCGYNGPEVRHPCKFDEGWGTEFETGFCKHHNDSGAPSENQNAVGNDGGSPPENNGNAETHGMNAQAEKWFERHRDDVGDRVRQKVAHAIEHVPFSWQNLMKMDELVQAAINQEQIRQGDRYISDIGIMRKETIPVGESAIRQDEENPASLQKSRLQKDTIRLLKDLGYLDDPDSAQADSMQSIAEILSDED